MSDRYTAYDTWAWLYNKTMGPQYGKTQFQWLQKMLLPHLPAQAHILDLCCGTGQLIQPLLHAGYQVTGLDGSEAMLNYARQNAPAATYRLEDARNFHSPDTFDAAFSTSASLNHVMSMADLTQVFRNVYESLHESGLFLFDLNHPGQLNKWWRGQIAEGEIDGQHAWFITPRYSSSAAHGAFEVTIFQAPKRPLPSWSAPWRSL
ncbi:MAG: class I SAM-dependent methyltransferase, partial [Cyanobacteria bacterium P01_H01_bin.121]